MARIQNNIIAKNTHRMYSGNNNKVAKAAEKLSSGYRINRAGDDAAGLAISEKMRAQVRGLSMATKNSNDAISLVQTAEGALQEVQNMLQRMNELAVQSASDTNVTIDRNALQLEFENLQDEIDQIAQTTKFNDSILLDGSVGAGNVKGAGIANTKAVVAETTSAAIAGGGGAPVLGNKVSYTVAWKEGGKEKSATVELEVIRRAGTTDEFDLKAKDGSTYAITKAGATAQELHGAVLGELQKNADVSAAFDVADGTGQKIKFTAKAAGADGAAVTALGVTGAPGATAITGGGIDAATVKKGLDVDQKLDLTKVNVLKKGAAATAEDINKMAFEIKGKKFLLAANDIEAADLKNVGSDVTIIKLAGATYAAAQDAQKVADELTRVTGEKFEKAAAANNDAGIAANDIIYKGDGDLTAGGSGLFIQVGAEEGHTLDLSISAMNTAGLGVTKADANISTREAASKAITVSRDAINKISTQRATLGAMQNRLEYKVNNLGTTTENLQAAESRIRDVDMADEMANFTKNNILVQASTAMLAQANSLPQNVLQLLG